MRLGATGALSSLAGDGEGRPRVRIGLALYLGGTLLSWLGPNLTAPIAVELTSPASGAQFALGAPITLTAVPSVGTATIDRVEFYLNGTLLGSATADPIRSCARIYRQAWATGCRRAW